MPATTLLKSTLNNLPCKQRCYSKLFASRSIVDLYKNGNNCIFQSLLYSRFANLYSALPVVSWGSLLYRVWIALDPFFWILLVESLIKIASLAYMALQWDFTLLFATLAIMTSNLAVVDRKIPRSKPKSNSLQRKGKPSHIITIEKDLASQSEISLPTHDDDLSLISIPSLEYKEFEPESPKSIATVIQETYKEKKKGFSFKIMRWKKISKKTDRTGSVSSTFSSDSSMSSSSTFSSTSSTSTSSTSTSSSSKSNKSALLGPIKGPEKKLFQFDMNFMKRNNKLK